MATYPSPTLQDLTVNGNAILTNVSSAAATITGGTIDGTPIGATTPAAVKATTLDASGAVSGAGFTSLLAPYTLSADLASTASGKGANLVGYLSPLTNAVARTLQSKVTDFFNAKDLGCAFDGTTNDTTDFQNALNAIGGLTNGGCLMMPSGETVLGAITVPTNVSIMGQGQQATTIIPAAASQTCFTITGSSVSSPQELSGFSINCGSLASIIGVSASNLINFTLQSIAFIGCLTNFVFDQGKNYSVLNCRSLGNATNKAGACKVWSSSDASYIYDVKIFNYQIYNDGTGVQGPVIYIRRGIGCLLVGAKANDCGTGGAQNFILFENDCQGCKVIGCMVAACTNGILFQQGSGVAVLPSFIDIVSTDVDQSQTAGINFSGANWCKVIGGNITSSGVATTSIAILVESNSSDITIDGVKINGYNGTNGTGIYFSSCSDVLVKGCSISSCYFGFVFASSLSNIHIFGTQLVNCTNKYNGTPGATGDWFANNPGFNPLTVSTPTLPASGTAYTNASGVSVRVYIEGGTFTAVSVNGTSINASGSFMTEILPGETIAITYSSTPTWTWVGM